MKTHITHLSPLPALITVLVLMPVFGAQAAVVFTTLYSFTGINDGSNPQAALVQGSDGYFYGTTSGGGTHTNQYGGLGTVFKISAKGAFTSLYSFTGTNDGANPSAALVQGSDGNFYGTTYSGGTTNYDIHSGTYGSGTVFEISTNGALTTLYAFGSITNATGDALDGANPQAALVQGSDGYFYGTTTAGGTNNSGTVFKISTNGMLTSLYSFGSVQDSNGIALDGSNPAAPLVQGSDGYFYGTTYDGGSLGTVFKISASGALTTLSDCVPTWAGLVQGSDGYFYGTTAAGYHALGQGRDSTVFKISTDGVLTTLYSFTATDDAWDSEAALVQGSDGNFYGTTAGGGSLGTMFKISTSGALTTLYAFGSITNANGDPLDGANPYAGLVQDSDASFYGTTKWGGAGGAGTVFRLTIVPDPQLTILTSGPYVILTWPTGYNGFSYAGYTLQSTTNLDPSAAWTTVSPGPVVIGGQNVVVSPISGTQKFFRLSQ